MAPPILPTNPPHLGGICEEGEERPERSPVYVCEIDIVVEVCNKFAPHLRDVAQCEDERRHGMTIEWIILWIW